MAARPIWRGQIRLALVSIPVELYSATKSGASIAFHQVHEPSGKRIRYEKVVPGIGPVDRDEIMKGYEVSKGHYVLLDPEEIEKVKLESRKTLDLVQFVDIGDIDAMYYEKPYYVVPADDLAEDAFVVLRDALRKSKKIGIGQLAMRGQEFVVALKPLRRRGSQGDQLFPRDRGQEARRGHAGPRLDADREKDGEVRRQGFPQPLCRCASRVDRGEAAQERREDHPGLGRR
jgi:hypothetical protein